MIDPQEWGEGEGGTIQCSTNFLRFYVIGVIKLFKFDLQVEWCLVLRTPLLW